MTELDLLAMISLAAVMMIGLPHGALDGAVAMTVGYGKRVQDMIKFAGVYTLITIGVVAVWMIIPIISLTLFMVISLVHFGLGDHTARATLSKYIQVMCHGGLVVALIPAVHVDEVEPIFMILTGATNSAQLSSFWAVLILLGVMFALSSVGYAILALKDASLRPRFAEFLVLGIALILLPPLTGFAVYFCAVHTMRHVRGVTKAVKAHDQNTKILPLTLIFTLLTWVGAGIILLLTPDSISFSDAVLRLVFIGLAALTVPHMMLVDGVFRPQHLNPQQVKGS